MAKKRNLRAVNAVEPSSDLEAFNSYIEDELEDLLDGQSDEDFGSIDYRNVEKKAKLSSWSAQDFSNIYLRYRPHLERHARRFLSNQTQVDEVVQDAFLYLMVTLPDLDSETGVLRFLKWKVRLICLDVIRASGRAMVNSLDDHAEMMADDPEISAGLEQADDAAIVKLALSKLNPRHREVLIASLYEEKSHEEVAAQIGLSENATRQLIFRARAAFKKALLGDDIDTDGMSVSAILSVAARRAAEEGKKVGAQAMVLALFLALSVGAFINFGQKGSAQHQVADGVQSVKPVATPESKPSKSKDSDLTSKPAASPFDDASLSPTAESTPISETSVIKLSKASAGATSFYRLASSSATGQSYSVGQGSDLQATFRFTPGQDTLVKDLNLQVLLDGVTYFVTPSSSQASSSVGADGSTLVQVNAALKYVYDKTGTVYTDIYLNEQKVLLSLLFDANQNLVQASLKLAPNY